MKKIDIWLLGLLAGNLVVMSCPICQAQQWSLLHRKLVGRPHTSPVWKTPRNSIRSDRLHMQGHPGNAFTMFLIIYSGRAPDSPNRQPPLTFDPAVQKASTPFSGSHSKPLCKWKFKQICAHAGFQVRIFFKISLELCKDASQDIYDFF